MSFPKPANPRKSFNNLYLLLLVLLTFVKTVEGIRDTFKEATFPTNNVERRNPTNNRFNTKRDEETDNPRTTVVDAHWRCHSDCNYNKMTNKKECMGLYKSSCKVAQLFKDGHILETITRVSCIGGFKNETKYDGNIAIIKTSCHGEFVQTQTIDVYEAVPVEKLNFVNTRRAKMEKLLEPSLLEASLEVRCDEEQDIQIQKILCDCNTDACGDNHKQRSRTFNFQTSSFAKLRFTSHSAENHISSEDTTFNDPEEEQFKKLAARDPVLASEVSRAVIQSVTENPETTSTLDDVPPAIRLFNSRGNIPESNGQRTTERHYSTLQPSSAWMHVSCNGKGCGFDSECSGLLRANVNFGREGLAYVNCEGNWKTYKDTTYVCDGIFSEDETDSNGVATYFSKLSECAGTVAVSPLATRIKGNTKYYGLSEICKGESLVRGSYILEELDHRILGQIVDPRTVQQVICLMANENCDQLRYVI